MTNISIDMLVGRGLWAGNRVFDPIEQSTWIGNRMFDPIEQGTWIGNRMFDPIELKQIEQKT